MLRDYRLSQSKSARKAKADMRPTTAASPFSGHRKGPVFNYAVLPRNLAKRKHETNFCGSRSVRNS